MKKQYYTMKNREPLLFLSFLSEKCCKVRLGQARLGQSETEIYTFLWSQFLDPETVSRPGVIHLYSADDKPTLKTKLIWIKSGFFEIKKESLP